MANKPSSHDIRVALFTVIKGTLKGTMEIETAQQVTKAAAQVTCSLRTDLEQRRLELEVSKTLCKPMDL